MRDNLRKFAATATVFREGEVGDWAYLVRSGLFEIYTGTGEARCVIAQAKPGTLFGELALIDRGRRMATARCIAAGEVALIDRPKFESKLSTLKPAHRQLYAELLGFIREEQPWIPEDRSVSPRSSPERVVKVKHILSAIESEGLSRTGDAFVDGLTRTIAFYARRRLGPETNSTPLAAAGR